MPRRRPHLSRVSEHAAVVGLGQRHDICKKQFSPSAVYGKSNRKRIRCVNISFLSFIVFITSTQGVLEPPRSSDCTIVVVSWGLGSTRCEEPSPVLVVPKLREVVFQLKRPT